VRAISLWPEEVVRIRTVAPASGLPARSVTRPAMVALSSTASVDCCSWHTAAAPKPGVPQSAGTYSDHTTVSGVPGLWYRAGSYALSYTFRRSFMALAASAAPLASIAQAKFKKVPSASSSIRSAMNS